MKTLVMYFSAEHGKTAALARAIADAANADLFEIQPVEPYSKADLNYLNPLSRCNKEKFSGKDIPIKNYPMNFDSYDLVLIGFPIWYGGAPNVVNFACMPLNFSNKKVALFATSASSKIGKSAKKLAPYINDQTVLDAKRFAGTDPAEIEAWLKNIL